jgi:hypothetical protein
VSDILLVALTLAFFALAVLLVRWCDHIIGPDDESDELDVDQQAAGERDESDELIGATS